MDAVLQHLSASDWLDLRDLLRLILVSSFFTIAALIAFPRNAPSRRALVLAAVISLGMLPWLLALSGAVWTIEVDEVPVVTLATMLPNLLLWIWLSVAVVKVVCHTCTVVSELKQIALLPRILDDRAVAKVARLSNVLDVVQPELCLGKTASSTSLGGNGAGMIVLPNNWRSWNDETLAAVIAHEMVHVHRRDDRWMLVTRFLALVYWWMPWINLLVHKHLEVMEESCDDAASELIGQPMKYVHALAEAAGVRTNHAASEPSVLAGMHSHHLVGRVGRFTKARVIELDTPGVYWCVIGILVLVGVATSVQPVLRPIIASSPDAILIASQKAATTSSLPSFYAVVRDEVKLIGTDRFTDEARLRQPEYQPPAIYPGNAIRKSVEGDVVIEFSVNRDGTVSQAEVLSSEPAGVFDASALRAVQNTRYQPGYTTNGRLRALRTETNRPPTRVQKHFRFRMVQD